RLSIHQVGDIRPTHEVDIRSAPREVVAAVATAAPHLEELTLVGESILASPGLPSVRTLRLTGTAALVIGGSPMAHVEEIDLAFRYRFAQEAPARLAALVNPRTFPALWRLDLSRNEYVYPTTLASNVGVFPFLREVEKLERIRWLRLPSLRTAADVAAMRELLESCPQLHVEVARSYCTTAALLEGFAHPRLTLPAGPPPWPPPPQL